MTVPRVLSALIAVGLLAAGAPSTVAADGPPTCEEATVEATSLGDAYVREDGNGAEAWTEENDVDGLQTQACRDADGVERSPDTRIVAVPDDLPDPTGLVDGCTTVLGGGPPNVVVCPLGDCKVYVFLQTGAICVGR